MAWAARRSRCAMVLGRGCGASILRQTRRNSTNASIVRPNDLWYDNHCNLAMLTGKWAAYQPSGIWMKMSAATHQCKACAMMPYAPSEFSNLAIPVLPPRCFQCAHHSAPNFISRSHPDSAVRHHADRMPDAAACRDHNTSDHDSKCDNSPPVSYT